MLNPVACSTAAGPPKLDTDVRNVAANTAAPSSEIVARVMLGVASFG